MKKRNLLVSCAALTLLLSALAGCGPKEEASEGPKSEPQSVEPSSAAPSEAPSSAAKTSETAPASSAAPGVSQNVEQDEQGATIIWNAQDPSKEASSGFTDAGKFTAKGDYVVYTFNSPMALKARLFVEIENRTDGIRDRDAGTGNQTIWFDYYNNKGTPDWKYTVTVNKVEIDQDAQADYKVGEKDIPMKDLLYTDFLESGASTLMAPWFEFDIKEGANTLRIERKSGYSVNMKSFKAIGKKVAAA